MLIISGIRPGRTGTGALVSHLLNESPEILGRKSRFIFGLGGDSSILKLASKGRFFSLLNLIKKRYSDIKCLEEVMSGQSELSTSDVVIIHPQTLGFKRCLDFMERRHLPIWLYLMDSSFFCIRSYNYIPGDESACLRCINSDFSNIKRYRCNPFPVNDPYAIEFIRKLKDYVSTQHVKIIAQTNNQAALARKYFGDGAEIKICGIWGDDWPLNAQFSNRPSVYNATFVYDVVYHGSFHSAKGAEWAVSVAEKCPDLKFLFPFKKLRSKWSQFFSKNKLKNMSFIPMTWNEGLKDAVSSAKLVIAPSLWSAPVEGALIKSIALSKSVAVVDNPTAFSSEIPNNIVFRLPANVGEAARSLKKILATEPNLKERREWYKSFVDSNYHVLQHLVDIVEK